MREWHVAKYEKDRRRCPRCNGPRSECGHPRDWFPQRTVCFADMETAAANAMYDLLHKDTPYHDGTFANWSEERSRNFPYHARDGVNIWASPVDLSPDDNFLTDADAPAYPRGGDGLGDQA